MQQRRLDDLLEFVPNEELERMFGVDSGTMERAVALVLSGLVSAFEVETAHPAGARALDEALQRRIPTADRIGAAPIDVEDGRRIVDEMFGKRRERAVKALAETADDAAVAALIPDLMPMLAPALMEYLAAQRVGAPNDAQARNRTGNVLAQLFADLTGERPQGGSLERLFGKLFRR